MGLSEASPQWLPYFAVADCDGIARRAVELGGEVAMTPTDFPGVGRGAWIVDPTGASFGIVQLFQNG